MNRIFSSVSLSSSDSYNSLKDLDKPDHIYCPICLMETSDNKVFKCKHAVCKDCFKTLKKTKPYKCPCCRKEYEKPFIDPIMLRIDLNFSLGGLSV